VYVIKKVMCLRILIRCKRGGRNDEVQKEDTHLETEEDVKGPLILFNEFEVALSELKTERQKERIGYQLDCKMHQVQTAKGSYVMIAIKIYVTGEWLHFHGDNVKLASRINRSSPFSEACGS